MLGFLVQLIVIAELLKVKHHGKFIHIITNAAAKIKKRNILISLRQNEIRIQKLCTLDLQPQLHALTVLLTSKRK